MISSIRRFWVALPVAGALAGAVGCGAEGSTTGSEPADDATEALTEHRAPKDRAAHARHPGPGGPEHLLFAALHELELTGPQKAAIEGAIEAARPKPGPEQRAHFTAVADGVRAGKIDTAAVLAKLDAERHAGERTAAAAAALRTLHATLTREQRRELVDAIGKRMEEHGPPGGPRGRDRGGPPDRAEAGPIGHLLDGIEVSDAQRAAIEEALEANRPAGADREARKERFEALHASMRARLEGFAADRFDAQAFVAPPEQGAGGGPKQHIERMLGDLAVVVPILDAAQREALAARLEKGPMGPPGHRGHGPGAHP